MPRVGVHMQFTTFDGEDHHGLDEALKMAGQVQSVEFKGRAGKEFRIKELPEGLWGLPRLERINVDSCPLAEIPADLCKMKSLRSLRLDDCRIRTLPAELSRMKKLEDVSLIGSPIDWQITLPVLQSIPRLRTLGVGGDDATRLPLDAARTLSLHAVRIYASAAVNFGDFFQALADGPSRVEAMVIHAREWTQPPAEIGLLSDLKDLLIRARLRTFPVEIGNLKKLQSLELDWHNLAELPDGFCELKALRRFVAEHGKLKSLPDRFDRLTALEILRLRGHAIREFPGNMARMKKLREVDLGYNKLSALPKGLEKLPLLERFDFAGNAVPSLQEQAVQACVARLQQLDVELPLHDDMKKQRAVQEVRLNAQHAPLTETAVRWLSRLPALRTLSISNAKELPDNFGSLRQVEELSFHYCNLAKLPDGFGGMCNLCKLSYSGETLTELPAGFGKLSRLQKLDLGRHPIEKLPDDFGNLRSLQTLTISLTRSMTFCGLPALEKLYLYLGDTSLPDVFADFPRLSYCWLCGNRLKKLPGSFSELPRLETLELRADSLDWPSTCQVLSRVASLKALHMMAGKGDLPPELAQLTQLQSLWTNSSDHANGPFPDLSAMTSLRSIWVDGRGLTSSKKAAIKSRLPNGGQGWRQQTSQGLLGYRRD
jgi:Leucine-rich repeat (LRR) protein